MKKHPIVLSVSGFSATAVSDFRQSSSDDVWRYLLSFPPFMMYLSEQTGSSDDVALKHYLETQIAQNGDEAVLDAYSDWHKEKGYWAGETVFGEPI